MDTWVITRWFTKDWWEYLLEERKGNWCMPWYIVIWCRIRGHRCGVWWYNPAPALDPDMHCKNCGDDLG